MVVEELNERFGALLAIFTLNFSTKMISLHVFPPYREIILYFRHLWFIYFDLVSGEPTVKTIFVNVSNPNRDPSSGLLNVDSRRAK